ncbi:MAG: hypothetical protein AAFU71_03685 [Cyanobacteria bacterium J06632_22]
MLFHSNSPRTVNAFPQPNSRQLFICLRAEAPPHPDAQLQVVQNPVEAGARQFYLPHWPQPGLLSRDPARGDRFESVAFLGHQNNLATELQSPAWADKLRELGLNWQPVVNNNTWNDYTPLDNRWHDYRGIDAVVAVRSFARKTWARRYHNKPPTKLFNTWRAGVPALLGPESAFRAVRQSSLDYIEVTTLDELVEGLIRLRDNLNFRQKVVQQANHRAEDCSPEVITQQWIHFLESIAIPAYESWCRSNRLMQQFKRTRSHTVSWRERIVRRAYLF